MKSKKNKNKNLVSKFMPLHKRLFEEFCTVAGISSCSRWKGGMEGKAEDHLLYCLLSAFSWSESHLSVYIHSTSNTPKILEGHGERDGEIGNGEEEVCACICNIINVLRCTEKCCHDAQERWYVWSRERASDKLAIIFFKFKTWREIPEPHWINVQPIRHSVCWF